MLDLISSPIIWFASAAVVGACTAGVVVSLFTVSEAERVKIGKRQINQLRTKYGLEPQTEIDMDLFDAEMAMEGARIEEQLAAERRALIVAWVR